MTLLQFQPSFAIKVNNNLDNISASSDIAILKKYNIISEDYGKIISVSNVSSLNNLKEYTILYGDTLNKVSILNRGSKSTTFNFKQPSDNISNILTIYENGRIFVDGQPVKITHSNEITPLSAGTTIYFTESPSYGSQNDYTKYYKQENISNIELGRQIKNFATGALVTIILSWMGANVSLALGILAGAVNAILDYNPNSTGLSSRSTVYVHKNYPSGYIPIEFKSIYMYKTTLYSEINYSGYSRSLIMYKNVSQG